LRFGVQLSLEGGDLGLQTGEPDMLFLKAKAFRGAIDFGQYFAGPHFLFKDQMRDGEAAGDAGLDGISRAVDFEAGRIGDFVAGDAGVQGPGEPGGEDKGGDEQGDGRYYTVVGAQRLVDTVKSIGHPITRGIWLASRSGKRAARGCNRAQRPPNSLCALC